MKAFMERMAVDPRLRQGHLGLWVALFYMGTGYPDWFPVTRRQLMKYAGIRSVATYHKYLAELVSLAFIEYRPSYDPYRGSLVKLITTRN